MVNYSLFYFFIEGGLAVWVFKCQECNRTFKVAEWIRRTAMIHDLTLRCPFCGSKYVKELCKVISQKRRKR